ncbi:MAG: hypothetical protein WD875_04490 [Pirellulales bacterium]
MSSALKFSSLHVYRFVQDQVDVALRPGRFSFDAARGMWTRALAGGIEHFVSLPTDIAGDVGPVVVTANLGVFYRPLVAKLARRDDLSDNRRRAQNLSTFTRNVGQLSGKRTWRDWTIHESANAERVAWRLAARIVSVGLPWLATFDSPAAVCEGFRTYGREDHRRYTVPLLERLLDGAAADAATNEVANDEPGKPRIFALRMGGDEITWHCDE